MCGIIGILSQNQAAPLLTNALKKLEYRGYDSAGIAISNDGSITSKKEVGKLINLTDLLVYEPLIGKTGIGHTRWATHGAPSKNNAHPISVGKVSVVHNGIIENYIDLKTELSELGHQFNSETDTETIAALCSYYLDTGHTVREASVKTISRLKGAFALCLLFQGEDDLLIAARKGSPLVIGHGRNEMFVGSDAIALSDLTNKITYLNEGDYAFITRKSVQIFNSENTKISRPVDHIDCEKNMISKEGYSHFMAKEIAEQTTVIKELVKHFINGNLIDLKIKDLDFQNTDRIIMVGCGTAFYACQVAKYWLEEITNIPVETDIASEFRYRNPPMNEKTMAIFVSQSGETADTLAALKYCKEQTKQTLSIVNVMSSTIARESNFALPILAGHEIGVASTKAFTSQLFTLAALSISIGIERQTLTDRKKRKLIEELTKLPDLVKKALLKEEEIKNTAKKIANCSNVLFMGRGVLFPIALEGALKLKEISYIHSEGYASGELKHGPIALVDEHLAIITFAPFDRLFEKSLSNIEEVLARNGKVILITDEKGKKSTNKERLQTITMPSYDSIFSPIIYAIPAQLLAYHVAVYKGTDVDQPRNLAKSVTVE